MAGKVCSDRVVGRILGRWRYDISSLDPEMRKDYEQHLACCPRCKSRQQFHRGIDVALVILTSLSVFFFLFALAALHHIEAAEHVAFKVFGLDIYDMFHMLVSAGVAGLGFSLIALILVLTATPVPGYLSSLASERAKIIEGRLPDRLRSLLER